MSSVLRGVSASVMARFGCSIVFGVFLLVPMLEGLVFYSLQRGKKPMKVESSVTMIAKLTTVKGTVETISGTRKLFVRYGFMGGLPMWNWSEQNETFVLPTAEEMVKWKTSGLCRIGAEGPFSGREANEIYENPFKYEKYVEEARLDKSERASTLWYHYLDISWSAKQWRGTHPLHLTEVNGQIQRSIVDSQNDVVKSVHVGSFIEKWDHVTLVTKVPQIKEELVTLRCYAPPSGELACTYGGDFIRLKAEEAVGKFLATKCFAHKCYEMRLATRTDRTQVIRRRSKIRDQNTEEPGQHGNGSPVPFATSAPELPTPAQPKDGHRTPTRTGPDSTSWQGTSSVGGKTFLVFGNGQGFPAFSTRRVFVGGKWETETVRDDELNDQMGYKKQDWEQLGGLPSRPNNFLRTLKMDSIFGKPPINMKRPNRHHYELVKPGQVNRAMQRIPSNFKTVKFEAGAIPSAADFEILQNNNLELKQQSAHNEAVLNNEICDSEDIIFELFLSLARRDDGLISRVYPSAAPFRTVFLSDNVFVKVPVRAEDTVQERSNCRGNLIYMRGHWVKRRPEEKCFKWNETVPVQLYHQVGIPFQDEETREIQHEPSILEEQKYWRDVLEYQERSRNAEEIFSTSEENQVQITVALKNAPGSFSGLFKFMHSATAVTFLLASIFILGFLWTVCGCHRAKVPDR